tara:strand:- start:23452 stop:23880 length:429 start_codon:yes stop_codon:yes gene_type:complete
MPDLLKIAWTIPAIPFGGSILIAVLLTSFNRTMNRLTKPVSFFLSACVSVSTLISLLMLLRQVSGTSLEQDIILANVNLHIQFYLDLFVEKLLALTGGIILVIMISSYYLLDRRQGYVLYFTLLAVFSSLLFFFELDGLFSQ